MHPANYTEEQLISLLKNNEVSAYSYLYDSYAGALYAVVHKIVQREEMATDALQEAFVKIWKSIHLYDPVKGRLFTWMVNIARNVAIDMLRSKQYRNESKNQPVNDDVSVLGESLKTNIAVDHIGIDKVLGQLKEDYRKIIDLAYFKGYTQEEIAEALNIPVGTVKTRARNAIIELRKLLKV